MTMGDLHLYLRVKEFWPIPLPARQINHEKCLFVKLLRYNIPIGLILR